MHNDQKFFEQIYKYSGTLVYLSENDEPAPYSILKKTILDFLKISESDKNKIWTSFGHLQFINLGIQPNELIRLKQYFIYPEDPLDNILALTMGYFCKIWENESDFNGIRDNVIQLIKKTLDKEVSWQTEDVCCDKKIFSDTNFSLLKGLYISPSAIPQNLFHKLNSYGISKWDEILGISELEIIKRFGFCVKAFDFLKCLWSLLPYAKYIAKLISPIIDQNNIWHSFESMVTTWISNNAKRGRDIQVLIQRMGLTSNKQETLESIAKELRITREHVRQIESKLVNMLKRPSYFEELLPLWIVIESFLQDVGILSVSELALQLQSYFKWEQPPHQHALIYLIIEVGPESVFRKDLYNNGDREFIFAKNFLCNDCIQVYDYLKKVVSNSEEISLIEATNILDMFCRKQCSRDYKYYFHFTHAFIDFLLVSNERLNEHIRKKEDKLYSINRWNLRYGNFSSLVESILKSSSRAMHFKEVFDEAKKLRPEDSLLSERYVHAILSGSQKVLLWERGTFVHKENLAAFPYGLIREIEDWIATKLKQNIPFVSVSGAFLAFKDRCINAGIPSEYALYSCLKMSGDIFFVFEHFPRIYSKKSIKEKLPMPMVIEEFIRESNGPVSLTDLRKYAVDALHLKEFMLNQYLSRVPNIINTRGTYIHTDNLKIKKKELTEIITYVKNILAKEKHISVHKVFNDKRVSCKTAGIDSPELLFSLLQFYEDDEIEAQKYPQLRLALETENNKRRSGILYEVAAYIKNKHSFCTYQELEDYFVKKLGYSERTVYFIVYRDYIYKYLPSCLIHHDIIEWTEEKQKQLGKVALQVYSDAVAAGKYYGLVENIIEIEYDNLPILANDICWTEMLLAELLNKSSNFKVIGSRKNAFVTLPNKFNIETFEDLLYVILKNDYNGAANLEEFARDLKEIGIIERGITKSMLDNSEKVTILGGEIILTELIYNAQKA